LPAEPVASALQARVAELAGRYDSLVFEPHMTLYSGPSDDREALETLDFLRASFRPLTLVPFEIAQSSRLTKTLYIRLELSSEIAALADMLKRRAHLPSTSTLDDPHVSLLYQTLAEEERAALAREIPLPAPFAADGIAVIETENPLVQLDQFRRWRFVGRFRYSA
jgi:putative hydrolase of the HAD superfamily